MPLHLQTERATIVWKQEPVTLQMERRDGRSPQLMSPERSVRLNSTTGKTEKQTVPLRLDLQNEKD